MKDLTGTRLKKMTKYIRMLLKEKKVRNIIGTSDPDEIKSKHIVPCMKLSDFIIGDKGIDVGSGNGFPGVIIAILNPGKVIWLLDISAKKINFLNKVKENCKLNNIYAVRGRAEELGRYREFREKFDFAVSRALAPIKISSEISIPFVQPGGHYYIMSGSNSKKEIETAEKIVDASGGRIKERNISGCVTIEKIDHTPEKYPRQWKKIR